MADETLGDILDVGVHEYNIMKWFMDYTSGVWQTDF